MRLWFGGIKNGDLVGSLFTVAKPFAPVVTIQTLANGGNLLHNNLLRLCWLLIN